MNRPDSNRNFELNADDHAEIERLTERARSLNSESKAEGSMSRRGFMGATGRVLAFVLPTIATFTVAPDALGAVGSGGGPGPGSMMMGGSMGMMMMMMM